MTVRAIAAESKNELYEGRLKDKDQTIGAHLKTIEVLEKQFGKSQENRTDAEKVFTGDARMLEAANGVIAEQKAEIAKLRNPGWFASIFDKRTFGGGIIGFGLCKVTNGGTTNPFPSTFGFQSAEDRAKQAMKLQLTK